MVAVTGIERRQHTRRLDTGPEDRNRPNLVLTTSSERWLRKN